MTRTRLFPSPKNRFSLPGEWYHPTDNACLKSTPVLLLSPLHNNSCSRSDHWPPCCRLHGQFSVPILIDPSLASVLLIPPSSLIHFLQWDAGAYHSCGLSPVPCLLLLSSLWFLSSCLLLDMDGGPKGSVLDILLCTHFLGDNVWYSGFKLISVLMTPHFMSQSKVSRRLQAG